MELNLLGRKIHVKKVSPEVLQSIGQDHDLLGFFEGSTIYISSTLPRSQFKRVLMHEMTHAVLSISGLTNLIGSKKEEAICDAMESFLETFKQKSLKNFLFD